MLPRKNLCIYIYIYMYIWRKIEKQSNPKLINLLEGKSMLKHLGINEPLSGL